MIDRKKKTITRGDIVRAYNKALELMENNGCVKGPKKLEVFGASYIYPIFLKLGVCSATKPKDEDIDSTESQA